MFMQLMKTHLFTIFFCLWATQASPLIAKRASTTPSNDPFYTPPAGYESTQPGTILATRPPPNPIAALGIVPIAIAQAQQILYRSTDSFGNPTATVTTIIVPFNADKTKLLSYQVAQDSSFLDCAPSYAFQFASNSGGLLGTTGTQIEILAIGAALSKGWIVTIPDHEGPNASFLANTRGGHAVLDAVRATLASGLVDPEAKVAVWGYSGGSLVSSYAAELQPGYAPELHSNLVGAVLGGTVPNITSATPLMNKSLFAGLLPGGILGLSHEYPEIVPLLNEYLKPEKAAAFRQTDSQCLVANILQFADQDITNEYFNNGTYFFYEHPTTVAVQDANALGKLTPQIPIFMYKGVLDEISAVADTDKLYNTYCSGGAAVQYNRDLTAEHIGELILGLPRAVEWIDDAFSGKVITGCQQQNVISSLLDAAALALNDAILAQLTELSLLSEAALLQASV